MPAHQRLVVIERAGKRRTASGEPQLPSATATLRSSLRRLARLMGEPLKRAENSSCVIVIHSISRGPSSPSRARNAASVAGSANEFQGQTSWEMYPFSHYSIPLLTGRRTVKGNTKPKQAGQQPEQGLSDLHDQ